MTKSNSSGSTQQMSRQSRTKGLPEDEASIQKGFTDYLRGHGYAPFTIEQYQRRLLRFAGWLCEHPRYARLSELTREKVPSLLQDFLPGCHPETLFGYRKVLFHWLKSQGRFDASIGSAPWQCWLDDYL